MKGFEKIILKKVGLVSYNERLYFYLEGIKKEKERRLEVVDNFLLVGRFEDQSS